ncbi:hypothetical protein [Ralstonia phage vB_RsoP_BMB50]|uniref:Uncharacterized protein n=1 Tax=Ralstonia phage vB_RsoP_BMB50 TaxID=2834269 RepID=A0A8E5NVH7_9CAUD|nr:hypothetical protein [Ralstonia phage vB_RsoP_BMB50]
MFVLKSKYDALKREAEANESSARLVLNQYRQREDNMERELRRTQTAYRNVKQDLTEANARLADLQTPKRDAGAQAFDNIVRHVRNPRFHFLEDADFAALELRVLAHYGLTAPYGGTLKAAREAVYEGHAGDGGIQRHSIGEEYPFIVYAEEFKGFVRWRIMDSRSGHTLVDRYRSAETAGSRALGLKKYDLRINAQGHAYHRS